MVSDQSGLGRRRDKRRLPPMAREALRRSMTVLLLGANGQLGRELRSTLGTLGDVVALARPDIDFAVPESLRAIVRRYRPSLVINAAAYTAVDKAEADEDVAVAVNT